MKEKTIAKVWKGCSKSKHNDHWAYYCFHNDEERGYWVDEHYDEGNRCYYRHYDFMSIPCSVCGAYSPLRADTYFLSGAWEGCSIDDVINYRPTDKLPDDLAYHRENGWSYIYFKTTLSDSLCGQETFRLRYDPND